MPVFCFLLASSFLLFDRTQLCLLRSYLPKIPARAERTHDTHIHDTHTSQRSTRYKNFYIKKKQKQSWPVRIFACPFNTKRNSNLHTRRNSSLNTRRNSHPLNTRRKYHPLNTSRNSHKLALLLFWWVTSQLYCYFLELQVSPTVILRMISLQNFCHKSALLFFFENLCLCWGGKREARSAAQIGVHVNIAAKSACNKTCSKKWKQSRLWKFFKCVKGLKERPAAGTTLF